MRHCRNRRGAAAGAGRRRRGAAHARRPRPTADPTKRGLHLDDQAALAHRRLSIVDLAPAHQPLANEDGTIWVVFNGEIYNHARPPRASSRRDGHRYRTQSDTETIVHAYEQWGDDCVDRFRGMFAFAIWDAPRRRLLLVRDRLGIKPLYWARVGDRLLFGSEIKALLASGLVEAPRPTRTALPELLGTRYLSGERDAVPRHPQAAARATGSSSSDGDVAIAPVLGRPAPGSADRSRVTLRPTPRSVARFRELLEESVRLRLMSDVPLGDVPVRRHRQQRHRRADGAA